MKRTRRSREGQVDRWWRAGFPGAFCFADPKEDRLYEGFRRVLLTLPDEHFRGFLDARPTIVCLPGVTANVFRYVLPVGPAQQSVRLTVMYFSPTLFRRTDESLASTVAHEVAHVILGQLRGTPGRRSDREAAADDLARQWGFARRYSARYLQELRGYEDWLSAEHPG
jgi:hypothetical protein